jgi:hypothetical protein
MQPVSKESIIQFNYLYYLVINYIAFIDYMYYITFTTNSVTSKVSHMYHLTTTCKKQAQTPYMQQLQSSSFHTKFKFTNKSAIFKTP